MTPTYGYRGRALEIIAKYGVKVGDRIIVRREGSSFVGILMPRSELDDDAHIVLKLDDGYNLGISVESLQIEKIPQEEVSPQPPKVPASRPGLPKVSIV
ncbi:MAG: hypothetical protein QXP73_04745, partial [Candidatus Methanomethylicaceae archaeon]